MQQGIKFEIPKILKINVYSSSTIVIKNKHNHYNWVIKLFFKVL